MTVEPLDYRTYIVRAWVESGAGAGEKTWRLTLEVPATGHRQGFHDPDEFLEALRSHLFDDSGNARKGS